MLRQNTRKSKGISSQSLRTWGLLMLLAGIIGQSVIQNHVLNMPSLSGEQLLKSMEDPQVMTFATIALVIRLISVCAIPIYAFLLVEGFQRTSSLKNYFLRVAGVALLTELPYNLAMGGKWIDMSSRNPVFGLVLGMLVLYFFRYSTGKKVMDGLIKVVIFVMAIVWSNFILKITDGSAIIIVVTALYALRKKRGWQVYGGCIVMVLCTAFSPLYAAAPITFLVIHFYNEEPGEGNRLTNYLAYPALLLFVGVMTNYIIK